MSVTVQSNFVHSVNTCCLKSAFGRGNKLLSTALFAKHISCGTDDSLNRTESRLLYFKSGTFRSTELFFVKFKPTK